MRLQILAVLLLSGLFTGQTPPTTIPLRPEPIAIAPTQFYLAEVTDHRPTRDPFARIMTNPATKTIVPTDLEGGLVAGIRRFYQQSFRQNQTLRPVTVQIDDCRATESVTNRGQIAGRFVLAVTVGWTREGEFIRLTTYGSSANYVRPPGDPGVISQSLRRGLTDAITQFNTWINGQVGTNLLLARSLRVVFTDYYRPTDARNDTVFYSPDRPLTWADFQAPVPRTTRYAAQVFPTIGYEGGGRMVNGELVISLKIKTWNPKSSSWVMASARTPYTLNHEQRHFDVARIAAEGFRQRIRPDSLTIEDYNSQIQYQFIEAFRDMGRLQTQYDGETNHGIDQAAQARWNQRIDADLHRLGIKP
jgi:hypothetical protein